MVVAHIALLALAAGAKFDAATSVIYGEAVSKANSSNIHWAGQFASPDDCFQVVSCCVANATAFTWFDPSFNHADAKWASGCYARVDGIYTKTSKELVTSGHIAVPTPPSSPTPPPTPAPPPPPTPQPAPFTVTRTQIAPNSSSAFKPGACGSRPQGAAARGVFYFLSPAAPAQLLTYTMATRVWGVVPIPSTVSVSSMLDGASMVAVEAVVPGLDDFIVVSGGRSKNVVAYNIQNNTWASLPAMSNSQKNSCSTSCRGYWFSMTGDMAKDGENKPANRQVYRYNITSGEHFENNGEKERGGAACGCDADANRVFWAGGFSDSGVTTDVEYWGADPLHRRGEPQRSTSGKRRDVGGVACGGLFVAAGGNDGKTYQSTIDIWVANSTATSGQDRTLQLGVPLNVPKVECLGGRHVIISGGVTSKSSCNALVMHFDTRSLPVDGATVDQLDGALAGVTGAVASATDVGSGTVVFFDGAAGELLSL